MAMNGNHQLTGFHRPNGIRGGGVLHGGGIGVGGGLFTTRVHRFFYWSLIFFLTNSFIIFICHHKVDQAQLLSGSTSNIMFSYDNKNENNEQKQKAQEGHQQEQAEGTEKDNELPIFAICLLTRDDIPILSEWIAYHYHAVNLRHLIVAVDPDSKQNPKPMFDKFRKHLGKSNNTNVNRNSKNDNYLIIDQWSDTDFMPEYFLNGEYGLAPNFVGNIENPDQSTWYDWYSTKKGFGYHKRQDQTLVNNHRYRQTRFLSKCSHYLKTKYSKNNNDNNNNHRNIWMSTLDTDEYLAINPWMMNIPDNNNNDKSKTKTKHENDDDNETEMAALRLEAGSVLRYLVNHISNNKNKTKNNNDNNGNVCIPIPRLLFGSVELNTTTTTTTVAAADATTIKRDVTSGLIRTKRSRTDEEEYGTSYSSNNVELAYNLPRSRSTMETLRWKYHASPYDDRNFQQKVILNLNDIPYNDEIFNNINNHVHTVHRPSRILCLPESTTNFNGTLLVGRTSNNNNNNNNNNNDGGGDGEGDGDGDVTLKIITQSPVVAYHYIGSEERYFSRPNDLRRNPKRYRERSNITYQRSNDYNWIDQWLVRFIEGNGGGEGGINGGVGIEVASILLQDHIIDVDDV